MRAELFLFCLLSSVLCPLSTAPAAQLITATIAVTNATRSGMGYTLNGNFRFGTNSTGGTFWTTNAAPDASATNIFNQLTLNQIGGVIPSFTSTSSIVMKGVGLTCSLTSNTWATLTLSTNSTTNWYALMLPFDNAQATNRTNNASELVYGIGKYSTNWFPTNAYALSNFLSIGIPSGGGIQQISARKFFTGGIDAIDNRLTNGFTSSTTNINPVTSNLVNYGNAIRSEGPGANSFQAGSNAMSTGLRSITIGANATNSGQDTITIGTSAGGTNDFGVIIGNSSRTMGGSQHVVAGYNSGATNGGIAVGSFVTSSGDFAIGMGNAAVASGRRSICISGIDAASSGPFSIAFGDASGATASNSMALGPGSSSTYIDSLALGPYSATTDTNQLRLGRSTDRVSIPGQLLISGTQSNTTFAGTNILRGSYSYPRFDLSTLAAGNNISVPFGTNTFIRLSAAVSNATVCGIVGSATSGGLDGEDKVIFNNQGYSVTFAQNTVDPIPANRIENQTLSDVVLLDQGWLQIKYSAANSRWKVIDLFPAVASTTNATAFGSTTSVPNPPAPAIGFNLQYTGAGVSWVGPDNGWYPVVDEEFLGDVITLDSISNFREPWYVTSSGGSQPPAAAAGYEDGLFGIYPFWSTNWGGRYMYIGGQSTQQGTVACTNLDIMCACRFRIGLTNTGSDLSALLFGLGNVSNGTNDPTDGIFLRTSTNANNNLELVTTRASARTVTSSLGYLGQWDGVSGHGYTNAAFVLDATGTNVVAYMGAYLTNMVAVATNRANVPNSVLVNPFIQARRINLSAGNISRTNYVDWYRLYVRRH